MTPREAIDLLTKYAYRCAEYDSMEMEVLRNALTQRRADYYVHDADGRRVPLVEALAELGLISDGGK